MQKCTNCDKQIPSIHVLDLEGGKVVRTQSLCETCAETLGVVQPKASALHLSSEILENLLGGLKGSDPASKDAGSGPAQPPKDAACPACGLTRHEFKTRGRLGCPRCYQVFRAHLLRLFDRVHDANKHTGRFPGSTASVPLPPRPAPDASFALRDKLRNAIDEERYEDAARLRDELRRAEEAKDTDSKSQP